MTQRSYAPHRARFAALVAALFFGMGALWSFTSPPGSAPDDAFHLSSTWCAWGDSESCIITVEPGKVFVPEQVALSECLWEQRGVAATCSLELTERLVMTTNINPSWGVYPPGFYLTMRALVGNEVDRSVIAMRILNSAIGAAFLFLILVLTRPTISRAALLAWVGAFSPMAIYYVASTNPSSWVIIGVSTYWAFLLSALTSVRWRSRSFIACAAAAGGAALLALAARADAIIYLSASTLAVVILAWPHVSLRIRRHPRITLGLLVGALVVALVAATNLIRYLVRPLSFPGGNFENDQPPALARMLIEFPSFLAGVIGGQEPLWTGRGADYNVGLEGYSNPGLTYGVGDGVHNPSISGLFVGAVVAGLFFIGFTTYSRRKVTAVGLLILAITVQAVIMRAKDGFGSGWLLQPRWFIPLVLVILGISLLRYPAKRALLNPFQRWIIVILITVASGFSYVATMWRYTVGQANAFVNLNTEPLWWWDTHVQPLAFVLANFVTTAAFVVVATRIGVQGRTPSSTSQKASRQDVVQPPNSP